MMTSVLMGSGRCEFNLYPDTPTSIKELLPTRADGTDRWRSHIAFTRHDFDGVDAALITQSPDCVWCGPVWGRASKGTRFWGPHMTGWLGNDRGGPALNGFGFDVPTWPATISTVVQSWFPLVGGTNGLRYGNAAFPPGTFIQSVEPNTYYPPLKPVLDRLMAHVGCEYVVTHDARVDWGNPTDLFSLTGASVVAAEGIGTSRTHRVLSNCHIEVEEDIYTLRNTAKVMSADGTLNAIDSHFNAANVITFYDGTLGEFSTDIIRVDTNDFTDVTMLADVASKVYAASEQRVTVTTDDFCVPSLISAGNNLLCWSPEDFIQDMGQELEVGGQTINPAIMRVMQMDAPFQEGMGAYVIRYAGGGVYTTTRITPYVVPETGPTTLTLGTRPRPFFPPRTAELIL